MTPAQQWQTVTRTLPRYYDTGALERRSPLPVGTYWIDQVGDTNISLFEDWISRNGGIVGLITIEPTDDNPRAFWYLFKVTGGPGGQFLPQWDGPGLPNIAKPGDKSSADTIQSPNVDDMGILELLGMNPDSKLNQQLFGDSGLFPSASRLVQTTVILGGVTAASYVGYQVWKHYRGAPRR